MLPDDWASVLSKKDCPDCLRLIYMYNNTWQSGQSFLERTTGGKIMGFSS